MLWFLSEPAYAVAMMGASLAADEFLGMTEDVSSRGTHAVVCPDQLVTTDVCWFLSTTV